MLNLKAAYGPTCTPIDPRAYYDNNYGKFVFTIFNGRMVKFKLHLRTLRNFLIHF